MTFDQLVQQLDAAGYFEWLDPAEAATVRAKIRVPGPRYLHFEDAQRGFHADAENLSEQGVLEFIAELAPQLARRGVHIPVIPVQMRPRFVRDPETGKEQRVTPTELRADDTIPDEPGITFLRPVREDCPEDGSHYTVTIGRHTQEMWNERMSDIWQPALLHTLLLLNQLLEDAGSHERAYGMYGGNDARVVFLTPRQFELIRSYPALNEHEKPYAAYVVEPDGE